MMTKGMWEQHGMIVKNGDFFFEVGEPIFWYDAGVESYKGGWMVLGAKDGKLLITTTESVCNLSLYGLTGQNGYADYGLYKGIEKLNEICKIFGKGKRAIDSRCINDEDINRITGFDPKLFSKGKLYEYGNQIAFNWNSNENGLIEYFSRNGLTGNLQYRHNYGFSYLDPKTNRIDVIPVGKPIPSIKTNGYMCDVGLCMSYSESYQKLDKLFGSNSYWLASSFSYVDNQMAYYGIRYFENGYVNSYVLYVSLGEKNGYSFGVRPVVTISTDDLLS